MTSMLLNNLQLYIDMMNVEIFSSIENNVTNMSPYRYFELFCLINNLYQSHK